MLRKVSVLSRRRRRRMLRRKTIICRLYSYIDLDKADENMKITYCRWR